MKTLCKLLNYFLAALLLSCASSLFQFQFLRENAPKIGFSIFLQSSFVADVGSVLLGLSLHGLALLAALEKGYFLGSQSKFQELRSASGFKRALDPRSKISRVRPARAETCHERKP